MRAFFSTLSCCWFWLLLGILIGWLLNRWLHRCCSHQCPNKTHEQTQVAAKAEAPTNAHLTNTSAPAKIMAEPEKEPKTAASAAKTVSPAVVIDMAAAKAAGFKLKNANDLTIIEGIGPKINALFIDNGVTTFADLANQTVPQMRAILDKGGARFRIANPSTWAKQAKLASENQWSALKKLQDGLSGGVEK